MKKYKRTLDMLLDEVNKQHSIGRLIPDFKTLIVVLASMGVDTIFIYQITDCLFYQSEIMSIITAMVVAFGLDATPVVIAAKIQKKNLNFWDIFILVASIVLFISLVVAVFALRWCSMDIIFSSDAEGSLITSVLDKTANTTHIGNSEKIMTVILSIMPVITSLITFASALHKPIFQKELEQRQINKLKNTERCIFLSARKNELERELKRDLNGLEEEKYNVHIELVDAIQEILVNQAKTALAMKLGNPEAITELLEGEDSHD